MRRTPGVMLLAFAMSFLAVLIAVAGLQTSLPWLVNAQLAGHAAWRHTDLAPGAAVLHDVEVRDARRQVVLSADEVRIRFAVDELWKARSWIAGIREIAVDRPRVHAVIRPDGSLNVLDVYRPPPRPAARPIWEIFHGLLLAHQGEVTFQDERAAFAAPFTRVEARLDFHADTRGAAHLSFDMPGAPRGHAAADATWIRSMRDPHTHVDVGDLDLARWADYGLRLYGDRVPPRARFRFLRGAASASLFITLPGPIEAWRDSITCAGRAHVDRVEAAAVTFHELLRGGHGRVAFTNDMLTLTNFDAVLDGDPVHVAGHVLSLRQPRVDLAVDAASGNLARTLRNLSVHLALPIVGSGQAHVHVAGPLPDPRVDGLVPSPRLVVGGRPVVDVAAGFSWRQGPLQVDGHLRAAGGGATFEGWILPRRERESPRLLLHVHPRSMQIGAMLIGMRGSASGDFTVVGPADDPLVLGHGSLVDADLQGMAISSASGSFLYGGRTLLTRDVAARLATGAVTSSAGYVDLSRRRLLMGVRGHGVRLDGPGGARVEGADFDGQVLGSMRAPMASGRLRADRLDASGQTLRDVDADVLASRGLAWIPYSSFRWRGNAVRAFGGLDPMATQFWMNVSSSSFDAGTPLGRGPLSLDLAGDLSRVYFDGGLDGPGGSFDALGIASPRTMRATGMAGFRGLDARLLAGLGITGARPNGRLDGALLFTPYGKGTRVFANASSRSLVLGGLPFRDAGALAVLGTDVAQLDDFWLRGPAAELSAHGGVPVRRGEWDLRWTLRRVDLRAAMGNLDREWGHKTGPLPHSLDRGRGKGHKTGPLPHSLDRGRGKGHKTGPLPHIVSLSPAPIEGTAAAHGLVRGDRAHPRVTGDFRVDEALLRGNTLTARVRFAADGARLALERGLFTLGGDPLSVRGWVGLRAPSRLHLAVATPGLNLTRLLAFTPYAAEASRGSMTGSLQIGGTLASPSASGLVTVRDAVIRGQAVDLARVVVSAAPSAIVVRDVLAQVGGGTVRGHGTLARVQAVLSGCVTLHGTPEAPRVAGQIRGRGVRLDGAPLGTLTVEVDWNRQTLEALTASLQGPSGNLSATARLAGDRSEMRLQAADFDLAALDALIPKELSPRGRLSGTCNLSGPLEAPAVDGDLTVRGGSVAALRFDRFHGRVSAANGSYRLQDCTMAIGPHAATLTGAIQARYRNGRLAFPGPSEIKGHADLADLDVLSAFLPGMQHSPGAVAVDFQASGTWPAVQTKGNLTVREATLNDRFLAHPVEHLNVKASLADGRLALDGLSGRLGGGGFKTSGGASLTGMALRNMAFNLSGQGMALGVSPYFDGVVDADLKVGRSRAAPSISGSVKADHLTVHAPLHTPSSVQGPEPTGAQRPVLHLPALDGTRLDVQVALGADAAVQVLTARVPIGGTLSVAGTWPRAFPRGPVTLGAAPLAFPFLASPVQLDGGRAVFTGASWIPDLEATATASTQGYDVYVDVRGPADDPQLTFSAVPELSSLEVQRLLILGQTPQPGAGMMSSDAPVPPRALNLLGSAVTQTFLSPLTSALGHLCALSDVAIDLQPQGGAILSLERALDRRKRFVLTFSTLTGVNRQSLPRETYGVEFRPGPLNLFRISTNNQGTVFFIYQRRLRFW